MTEKQRILKNYRNIFFKKLTDISWINTGFMKLTPKEQKGFRKYLNELEKDVYYKGFSVGRNIAETLQRTE